MNKFIPRFPSSSSSSSLSILEDFNKIKNNKNITTSQHLHGRHYQQQQYHRTQHSQQHQHQQHSQHQQQRQKYDHLQHHLQHYQQQQQQQYSQQHYQHPQKQQQPRLTLLQLTKYVIPKVRRHPVLLFGLPFVGTLLTGSFILSNLTQTRYDYNSTRVQTLDQEEKLQLDHNRKRLDLREEYFKLNQPADVPRQLASPSHYGAHHQQQQQEEVQQEHKTKKDRKHRNWDWDGEQVRVPRLPGMAEWGSVDPRDQSPEVQPRLV